MSEANSAETARSRAVSVIATVRNEEESIEALISALVGGTRRPDEIVVSDAESTDGTRQRLAELSRKHDELRVLDVPGNRSRGRNAAIRAAAHDVIATIDGGCLPQPDWLVELVEPFAEGVEWVGGFYRPVGSRRQVCIGLTMVYVLEEAQGGSFLPSARSMAFTRSAWQSVGGFPEGLVVSEDTRFDERLAAAGHELVFRPEAVVDWHPPPTLRAQARAVWAWARSDGRAGISAYGYRWQARRVGGALLLGGGAALVDPRLSLIGLIPLLDLFWRETRHKYRWAEGPSRFLWIPLAWAVGLGARLVGYSVGRLQRDGTGE